MSPPLVGLLAALVVLAALGPRPGTRRRRLRSRAVPAGEQPERRRPLAVPLLAGAAAALLVGGVAGVVVGALLAAVLVVVLGRLEPAGRRRLREDLERRAPLAVDLVAACLASGAPLDRALDAAADAVGGPVADVLGHATASLRLGADPAVVWARVGSVDALGGLARAVARSQQTGAPLSALLPRVAEQARAAHRARAEARIRTAAVRLTAPLGAAFLPAFVLLGVVPVVASWVGVLL